MNGMEESGWHGVGSIDRAASSGLLSSRSSLTRDGGLPLRYVDLAMTRIMVNIFYDIKLFYSDIRYDKSCISYGGSCLIDPSC